MVKLNKIYTRTGDDGSTGLAAGPRRQKSDLRVAAYGTVDETNAVIGMVRTQLSPESSHLDKMLADIQNDLFDLGADLATPQLGEPLAYEALRIVEAQVSALEARIDELNRDLEPLTSFILPGGTPASANLHLARTIARRAERLMVELSSQDNETVGKPAIAYINRLSDFLFVSARTLNDNGKSDVLWVPGKNRS